VLALSGSTWSRTPGSTRIPRKYAIPIVARRDKPVGTPTINFSGFNTFRVGYTRYRSTSPTFVPTHLRARYRAHSKARYWARG
jgi:hypothetical protein